MDIKLFINVLDNDEQVTLRKFVDNTTDENVIDELITRMEEIVDQLNDKKEFLSTLKKLDENVDAIIETIHEIYNLGVSENITSKLKNAVTRIFDHV